MCGGLRPDHFADPINGLIYAAILEATAQNGWCDAISIQEFLNEDQLEAVGGWVYLAHMLAVFEPPAKASRRVSAIRKAAWLREAYRACSAIKHAFPDPPPTPVTTSEDE
jgi:replicative DNA helicase